MAIKYRIDVLAALKEAGYSSYKMRKEKVMGEATIQAIRSGQQISWDKLSILCNLLQCQPGDILEYVEGEGMVIEE